MGLATSSHRSILLKVEYVVAHNLYNKWCSGIHDPLTKTGGLVAILARLHVRFWFKSGYEQ